uniref:Protein artemis n=1 Tax=Bionectria ochroleuca TaxID=29856 RepID=A0A8H7TSY9_BIOOC
MSTFDGLVAEFPGIRIDHFRSHSHLQPPLACFLSHVHSDHLAGLETLRSPFVYCSAATRAILLRLERYPCRINYALGILETRQQTYKHLHKVLKPLPLDTPTCIELQPGHQIQVTLLDANHCPGSVMFLIEGDGRAILYTGDIRSEPWFVNSIQRNPAVLEYTLGSKTLDKIYLDTSFIDDVRFPTKAEGIVELLAKVCRYPDDTIFHFQAWTYGYEDVWVALAKSLKTAIHVDDYKVRIYKSLKANGPGKSSNNFSHLSPEAPALVGHMCGNSPHPGCLTSAENARVHSCEKGNMCSTAKAPSVVRIQPIIARMPTGVEMIEAGIGGGGEDLERENELDALSADDLRNLQEKIRTFLNLSEIDAEKMGDFLSKVALSGRSLTLDLQATTEEQTSSPTIGNVIQAIAKQLSPSTANVPNTGANMDQRAETSLPRVIRFPYSRHSSYHELCLLVAAFKPRDVWPCTVNIDEWLKDDVTIKSLFGEHCSGTTYAHDLKMDVLRQARPPVMNPSSNKNSQETDYSRPRTESPPASINPRRSGAPPPSSPPLRNVEMGTKTNRPELKCTTPSVGEGVSSPCSTPTRGTYGVKRRFEEYSKTGTTGEPEEGPDSQQTIKSILPGSHPNASTIQREAYFRKLWEEECDETETTDEAEEGPESQQTDKSFVSTISPNASTIRKEAYHRMLMEKEWDEDGLISTSGGHTIKEEELGH